MKRSFLTKQLQSIKMQVDSLLENEGKLYMALDFAKYQVEFLELIQNHLNFLGKTITEDVVGIADAVSYDLINHMKPLRIDLATTEDLSYRAGLNMIIFFRDNWRHFKSKARGFFDLVKKSGPELQEMKEVYALYGKEYQKLERHLDSVLFRTLLKVEKAWDEASNLQIAAFVFVAICALIFFTYVTLFDFEKFDDKINDIFYNAWQRLNQRIGSLIIGLREGTFLDILRRAFLLFWEVLATPFKLIAHIAVETYRAPGLIRLISLMLVSFMAWVGFIYYRTTGITPETLLEKY